MRFSSKKKNAMIWNGGKPIRFKDGVYETKDAKEIAALKKVEYVDEVPEKADKKPAEDGSPDPDPSPPIQPPPTLGGYENPAHTLNGQVAGVQLNGSKGK